MKEYDDKLGDELIGLKEFDDSMDGWVILPREPLDMETNGWELDHRNIPTTGINVQKEGIYEVSYGMKIDNGSMDIVNISVKEVIEAKEKIEHTTTKKKVIPAWQKMNKRFKDKQCS